MKDVNKITIPNMTSDKAKEMLSKTVCLLSELNYDMSVTNDEYTYIICFAHHMNYDWGGPVLKWLTEEEIDNLDMFRIEQERKNENVE